MISYTEVREELRITPAVVEQITYLQEIVICPKCKKNEDETFVMPTALATLMPHSSASPSTVEYVMHHKAFIGTSYYRQETAIFQMGLKLLRETMANW